MRMKEKERKRESESRAKEIFDILMQLKLKIQRIYFPGQNGTE